MRGSHPSRVANSRGCLSARGLLRKLRMRLSRTLAFAVLTAAPAVALADNDPSVPAAAPAPVPAAAPVAAGSAVMVADNDPAHADPVDSAPSTIAPRLSEKYGMNGRYGQLGTFELGASAGLTLASNLRDVSFSPSFGYFVGDTFEVSGILGVTNIAAGNESSTVYSAMVEPSFHFAMSRDVFAFVGMGGGAAYVSQLGTALAVAPRAGFNVLVGKSGVLTPSLSYEYTMHDTMSVKLPDGTTDVTLLAVSSQLRANIGYSVIW